MATSEIPGLLKYKDENGNINLLLPITTKDNVDGLDEIEAELNETIKYTTQELNEAQKAQARANLGITDSMGSGSSAIIDVTELPTDNIVESCFYRLSTGKFIYGRSEQTGWKCHIVNGLPEVFDPVSTDMVNVTAYYNTQDGVAYGYVDETVSSVAGAPVGLYTLEMLAPSFGLDYGGVINNISDVPDDTTIRLLVKHTLYTHKEGWKSLESFVSGSSTGTNSALPEVTTNHNGNILQVVDGSWTVLSVSDSAVKTYIDEYLSSALEGEY